MRILDEKYSKIVAEEKELLDSLLVEIKELADEGLAEKLRLTRENLDNLFSVVFIGEFSTGKSSLINALLGRDILPLGITPTTDQITVIKHGEVEDETVEQGVRYISVSESRLKGFNIVDTPGTNVTIEQHEQITQDFIPKADIVFFTIGAERAVTGSETELIKLIKEDWLKNIVFLLNKIDIVNEYEIDDLLSHVQGELERIFGIKPFIIPVSSNLATEARATADNSVFQKSGFDKLEEYIFKTLGEEERILIKIKNSADLAISLCEGAENNLSEAINKITEDKKKLGEFERSLDGMKDGIIENSSQFTERIRSRMLEFKTRGIEYIDDLIRFGNIITLMRKDKVAKEFEYRVSRQTVGELEKDLDAIVNWTEKSARSMLDNAINFYNNAIRADSSIGTAGFSYDRTRLIDTVRTELESKRKEIDPVKLGGNLVDSARGAVASVLGVQVGSLAVGAAVVSAFSSFIVDITGILATVAIMATAFAILPKKRRVAMKEFSEKVDALIEGLTSSVSAQMERDFNGIKIQVLDSLVPLNNFYKLEEEKLTQSVKRVQDIKAKFENLI